MINNPKNTKKAPTGRQFRAMARTAKRTQQPIDWFNLGCCYHYGFGTYPNPTEAAACYAKAEAMGFIPAATNLGLLQLHGQGVPQDTFKGLALLKKAADSGEVTAMTLLSQAFLLGRFPELDGNTEIGVQWLLKAAEAGNPVAPTILFFQHFPGNPHKQRPCERVARILKMQFVLILAENLLPFVTASVRYISPRALEYLKSSSFHHDSKSPAKPDK